MIVSRATAEWHTRSCASHLNTELESWVVPSVGLLVLREPPIQCDVASLRQPMTGLEYIHCPAQVDMSLSGLIGKLYEEMFDFRHFRHFRHIRTV